MSGRDDGTPAGPQIRLRSAMMVVALVAFALWLARETSAFWVLAGFAAMVAIGAGVIGLGVGASWVGFRLFGLADRWVATVRGEGWPGDDHGFGVGPGGREGGPGDDVRRT